MSLANATATAADGSGVHPPLDIPNPSPKIGIDDPEFENLTTAEKLNDRGYRELVYETYPNEPTCACEPTVNGIERSHYYRTPSFPNVIIFFVLF